LVDSVRHGSSLPALHLRALLRTASYAGQLPVNLFLVLCFQLLLELRYFLVPYIVFRLNNAAHLQGLRRVAGELGFLM